MSDRDKVEDLFDLFDTAMDIVDENEDKINRILDRGNTINIEEGEPLRELYKNDDNVKIVMETNKDYDKLTLGKTDGGVLIEMDDKNVSADVPDDCDVDNVEASLNNGILEITIPRE